MWFQAQSQCIVQSRLVCDMSQYQGWKRKPVRRARRVSSRKKTSSMPEQQKGLWHLCTKVVRLVKTIWRQKCCLDPDHKEGKRVDRDLSVKENLAQSKRKWDSLFPSESGPRKNATAAGKHKTFEKKGMKGRKGNKSFLPNRKAGIQPTGLGRAFGSASMWAPFRESNFECKPYYILMPSDCIFVLIKLIILQMILSSRIMAGPW